MICFGGALTGGVMGGAVAPFSKASTKPKDETTSPDNSKLFEVEELNADDIITVKKSAKKEEKKDDAVLKENLTTKEPTQAQKTIDDIVQARADAMGKSKEELLEVKPLEVQEHDVSGDVFIKTKETDEAVTLFQDTKEPNFTMVGDVIDHDLALKYDFKIPEYIQTLGQIDADNALADLTHLYEKHKEVFKNEKDVFKLINSIIDDANHFVKGSNPQNTILMKKIDDKLAMVGFRRNDIPSLIVHALKRSLDKGDFERLMRKQMEGSPTPSLRSEIGLGRMVHEAHSSANETIPQTKEEWNKNLMDWHKDSHPLTKNEDGTPKVFYHGTTNSFSSFNPEKRGDTDSGWYGKGYYFSSIAEDVEDYAGGKWNPYNKFDDFGNIMPVFLDIKNPKIINEYIGQNTISKHQNEQELIKQGYDGVIVKRYDEDGFYNDEYVVFNPTQIKSIHNRGTFDSQNPNILFQTLDDATEKISEAHKEGFFGAIFTKYKHDYKSARDALLEAKSGDAIGALQHKELGDIDLVYGIEGTAKSDGMGLAKIAKYHPEVLDDLQNIIYDMPIVSQSKNRINLESDIHKASVRLDYDGVTKHWLLTAFEKRDRTVNRSTDLIDTSINADGKTTPSSNDKTIPQTTQTVKGSEWKKNLDDAYRDAIKDGDFKTADSLARQFAQSKGYSNEASTRMAHTAPTKKDGYPSIDNLKGAYPDDTYTHGVQYYGDGYKYDKKAIDVLNSVRNNPEKLITVYRAVPSEVDGIHLRNGDWISTVREYALAHGQRNFDGDFKIIAQKVPAKHIYTDGNSIHEYGYDDGLEYVYKNTANNKKIVHSDDNIPLSFRFDENNPNILYQHKGNGKKTADMSVGDWDEKRWRENRVQVSDDVFEQIGISKGGVFADYIKLAQKHPEYFSEPKEVKAFVDFVLEKPEYLFPSTKKEYSMLVRTNGKDKGVVVDLELKGGKYRVRSAIVLNDGQLKTKLQKAKEAGEPILQFRHVNSKNEEHPSGGTVPLDTDSPLMDKTISQNTQTVKGSVKGMFEKFGDKGVITLFSNSDMTTVFHESAHYIETTFTKEERVAFDEAFGTHEAGRARSEAFAEGFVKWAATGEAKNTTIARVFEKTREFLREVLSSLMNSKEAKFKLTASQELFYRAVFGDEEAKVYFVKALEKREDSKKSAVDAFFGEDFSAVAPKGQAAVSFLLAKKTGHIKGAFTHSSLGDIDLAWGNEKAGLRHILESRAAQWGEEKTLRFLNNLADIVQDGILVVREGERNRAELINPKSSAVVSLVFNESDRHWLMSAYKDASNKNKFKELESLGIYGENFKADKPTVIIAKDGTFSLSKSSYDKSISQDTRLFQDGVQEDGGFKLPNAMPIYNFLSDFLRAQGKVGAVTKEALAKVHADKLYEAMSRHLVYGGNRADAVIDAFSAYKIEQSARGNKSTEVYKHLQKLSKKDRENLHLVLSGDKDVSTLSPSLESTYKSLRNIISQNAKELIELGELKADESIEHYLARTYQKDVKEASSLQNSIFSSGGSVDHIKARRGKEATMTVSSDRAKDFEVGDVIATKNSDVLFTVENITFDTDGNAKLTLHRDYTFDERTQMGEIRDAAFSVWYTLQKQNSQIVRAKLLSKIPTKAFDSEEAAKAAGFEKVPDEATADRFKLYSSLGGKYISAADKADLDYYLNISQASGLASNVFGLWNAWTKGVTLMKLNDTVKNASTHLNNFMSNVFVMSLRDPLAFTTLANPKRLIADYKRIYELGLAEGEMPDIEPSMFRDFGDDAAKNTNVLLDMATRGMKELFLAKGSTLGNGARAVYRFEDSLFKAMVFGKKMREGLSEDAVIAYIRDS